MKSSARPEKVLWNCTSTPQRKTVTGSLVRRVYCYVLRTTHYRRTKHFRSFGVPMTRHLDQFIITAMVAVVLAPALPTSGQGDRPTHEWPIPVQPATILRPAATTGAAIDAAAAQ